MNENSRASATPMGNRLVPTRNDNDDNATAKRAKMKSIEGGVSSRIDTGDESMTMIAKVDRRLSNITPQTAATNTISTIATTKPTALDQRSVVKLKHHAMPTIFYR